MIAIEFNLHLFAVDALFKMAEMLTTPAEPPAIHQIRHPYNEVR